MQNKVYFMTAEAVGLVKIGVSGSPEQRFWAASGHSPVPLTLAAVIPGGMMTEARFHAYFRDEWSHFEWFRLSPRLRDFIAAISADAAAARTIMLPDLPHRKRIGGGRRSADIIARSQAYLSNPSSPAEAA